MAILGILILIGGAMAGLVGLGGIDLPEFAPDDTTEDSAEAEAQAAARSDLLLGGDGAELLAGAPAATGSSASMATTR